MKRRVVPAALLFIGLAFAAQGVWIHAKAAVAQLLLEMSWRSARATGVAIRPWPWADTRAVAKLDVAGRSIVVLGGASGRTMAFGPGHIDGTALPGQRGNCVITAHRDTHFAGLRDVIRGDSISLRTADGRLLTYEVKETRVVGKNETWVLADDGSERLTLITCYPFESVIPGGPLRYVVFAERVSVGAPG